jgi:hypothetical protein
MVIRALQVLGVRAKDGTGPIYPGSVADVDDKAAERFIAVGAAIKASRLAPVAPIQAGDAPETGVNPSDTGTAGNEPSDAGNEITGTEDLGKLEDMSFNQLKEMAKGLKKDEIRSKKHDFYQTVDLDRSNQPNVELFTKIRNFYEEKCLGEN